MRGARLLEGLWASSASAAVIIVTVLLLRALFQNRTPRRVICLLWDVALARLLILTALSSPVSIWQWLPAVSPAPSSETNRTVTHELAVPVVEAVVEDTTAAPDITVPSSALFPDKEAVLTLVWLTVALTLAAWFLWSHLRSRKLYADSLPCKDPFVRDWLLSHPLHRRVQARTTDHAAAPLTCKVLRPVVLLPAGIDWTDRVALSCVLEHEYQHIRRFDTLRKALLAAALCLHWFNPLVWILYVLSNRDMELACDEAVTAQGANRAEYARTLLNMEEQRSQWELSGSHFSQNVLEERIRCIMEHKKTSATALAVVFIVMSIATSVFSSAASEETKSIPSGQNAPETAYIYNHYQAVENDVMILPVEAVALGSGALDDTGMTSFEERDTIVSEEASETDFDQGLIDNATVSSSITATAETGSVAEDDIGANQTATSSGSGTEKGQTFEEIFAQYQSYGLVYSPRENALGSLIWNGQTVKSFVDLKPDGSTFSYQDPNAQSGLLVYTEYDADGNLTGLRGV